VSNKRNSEYFRIILRKERLERLLAQCRGGRRILTNDGVWAMLRRPVLAKGLDTRRRLKALAAVVVLVKESILEEWKNRRMNE
jgi:hypothetical protein